MRQMWIDFRSIVVKLYIIDKCHVTKAFDFILFADDTDILFSHNDPNQLLEIMNNESKKLSSWFQAN